VLTVSIHASTSRLLSRVRHHSDTKTRKLKCCSASCRHESEMIRVLFCEDRAMYRYESLASTFSSACVCDAKNLSSKISKSGSAEGIAARQQHWNYGILNTNVRGTKSLPEYFTQFRAQRAITRLCAWPLYTETRVFLYLLY
jgi:hypothetical protein